ncbi:hypothetical protein GobsT_31140 [Gemmata obscuriglobus]|uniref:Uncharacterized protein n=1 Tax=Gemmata obscuriglobus TaxID=114 RepID=A0A2Z3H4T0_9BACT|nr:hypothetical protein [Gemmata obscuriglobus]AWM38697.1 hypothetical protein C1280_18020 [Gemmata obscuriglobus]QEG28337.1 hypothetical protein GobsT_31140 [Gemmata obscuriglobus]VTS06211.1 unnamed protein product [Gemmata obscuriglobus UQM 2246]
MVPTLREFLKANPSRGFRSAPQYFSSGDYLTYFIEDASHYAERLDEVLTVYLHTETKNLVGVKVKGVRHIMKTVDELELVVDGDSVKLGVFIFAGAAADRPDRKADRYAQLVKLKDVLVSRNELPAKA